MSTKLPGRPALVQNNLPTAKTVTSATNATPIVVTTSAAHKLKTNNVITISGVTGNTAANGTFVASVLSSTTVALLAFPGGTSVAGSGAYVSGGTLQNLSFGKVFPEPDDLTDGMRAGSVNVAIEALNDKADFLMLQAHSIYIPSVAMGAYIAPGVVAGTGAYVDTTILVDVPSCAVGDFVQVMCNVDSQATDTSGVMRVDVYEDHSGANVLMTGVSTVTSSTVTASLYQSVVGGYTVSLAGTARIMLRTASAVGQHVTFGLGQVVAFRFRKAI